MTRETQQSRLLALLQAHKGEWVPLPVILRLFIANYRARMSELRRTWSIELRDEYVEGQRRTAYRILGKKEN